VNEKLELSTFQKLISDLTMFSCSACVQRCLRNGVGIANRQFSSYLRQKVRNLLSLLLSVPLLQHVA